jgi:choice-of-anchor A domain-containing protein
MATAHAGTALTAGEVLNQFNLVTLGDATIYSHVDGRSYIGGDLTGNGAVFAMHPSDMPSSSFSGLTVDGSASGLSVTAGGATILGDLSNSNINSGATVVTGNASNTNFNGSGGSYVYGTKSGVNANSGTMSSTAAANQVNTAQSTNFSSVLTGVSNGLQALSSTGSYWSVSGNRVTFTAVANSNGLAVFDLTGVDDTLLNYGEFDFNLGSASTVVFNSDVSSANIHANFLNGSAAAIGSKTIWNFYNASSLTFGTQFGGSVLATQASMTNYNNIEGGVFVNRIDQRGEIHLQPFKGDVSSALPSSPVSSVPEPSSWALMLAGVLVMLNAGLRRRRT